MIARRGSPRCSSDLRLIWIRPLLTVVFVPSMPMKLDRLSTARVFQDDPVQCELPLAPSPGTRCPAGFGDSQDDAGVLDREEAFGGDDVEIARRHERGRTATTIVSRLVPQNPAESDAVAGG